MADATFDVVVIGGGTKSLITAIYLAKYGKMSVGVFDREHEIGGAWCTDEGAAPGFLAEYHASSTNMVYMMPVTRDFPEWEELGGVYNDISYGTCAIFEEDQSHTFIYGATVDPTMEKTAKSIARFSEKDAETWMTRIPKIKERLIWQRHRLFFEVVQ